MFSLFGFLVAFSYYMPNTLVQMLYVKSKNYFCKRVTYLHGRN